VVETAVFVDDQEEEASAPEVGGERIVEAMRETLTQSHCRSPHSAPCSVDNDRHQTMTDTPKKRLIEALRRVDMHGDVAPCHVQDPMTMVLRQKALQANLMRWDNSRAAMC
jgi:hypothetical protein